MNDFEDVILPDDFEAQPEAEAPEETDLFESEEVTPPQETETQETPAETLQALKIKYNHEEREIPLDEAIPLVQKGLNYDKVQERLNELANDPTRAFFEELAQENGMSLQEYVDAVRQQREQSKLDELIQQNIPEELAREIMENQKFREQYESERQTKAQEEEQKAEFGEFFDYFKEANGRDYTDQDEIPQEVWEAQANGVPLKYAYMEHHIKQLQAELKVLKHNEQVTKKAPVNGLTTHGSTEAAAEDPFLAGFNSI